MKINILSLLGIVVLFLGACKGTEKSPKTEVESDVKKEVVMNPNCIPIILDKELFASIQSDGIQVLESNIKGNYLYLKYQFSGCPSDEINLVWNSALKKSMPGQASLKLGFEETGNCDEMQTQETCYNLKDFVQYKSVYLSVNGNTAVLFEASKN